MQKTGKSVARCCKITARGKLLRRSPSFRHLLASKSTRAKRRAASDKRVSPGHAAKMLLGLRSGIAGLCRTGGRPADLGG